MKSQYFVALFSCLLAGCGGSAPPSQTFHLNVERDHGNNDQRQGATVAFHVPPQSEISVGAGQDRSSISFDGMNANGDRECVVRLVAERHESQADGRPKVEILIRLETKNGLSAGGPSIYTVDADTSLKSMFDSGERGDANRKRRRWSRVSVACVVAYAVERESVNSSSRSSAVARRSP